MGLDPQERSRFRSLLEEIAAGVAAVIVSTHQVDDLGEQYDQVAVMDRGAIVFDASTQEFLRHGQGASGLMRAESAYAGVLGANRA